jgi:hypothetical protein
MTPEESGDGSLEATAKEAGFDNPEALVAAAKRSKARDAYDGRQSKQIRELTTRIDELETTKHESDLGIGEDADETSKRLAREIRELKSTVTTLTTKMATTPEDQELGEYFDQVLTEYPEVKDVRDPIRRMEMARRLARQLKAETEEPATQKGRRGASEAHLTGGDTPVSRRTTLDEDQAMTRYQRDLAKAKGDAAKEEVNAKYRALFPDWGV